MLNNLETIVVSEISKNVYLDPTFELYFITVASRGWNIINTIRSPISMNLCY